MNYLFDILWLLGTLFVMGVGAMCIFAAFGVMLYKKL